MKKVLLLLSFSMLSLTGSAQFTLPQLIQQLYVSSFTDNLKHRNVLLMLDTAAANLPDSIDAQTITATNTFFRGGTGDMDGNGDIQISDAVALENILLDIQAGTPPTVEQLFVGDVDGDGFLSYIDYWLVRIVLVGYAVNSQNYIDAKENNRYLAASLYGLSNQFSHSNFDNIPYFNRDLGITGRLMITGESGAFTSSYLGYNSGDIKLTLNPGFGSHFAVLGDTLSSAGTMYSTEGNSFQWDSAYQVIKAGVGGTDLQGVLDQGSVAEITAPFSVKTTENIDWSLDAINKEFNIWADDNQTLIFRSFQSPIGTHVEIYGGANELYYFVDNANSRNQFNQPIFVQGTITSTGNANLQGLATTGAHVNLGINVQDQIRTVALSSGTPSFTAQSGDHVVHITCADEAFSPVANLPTTAAAGQILRLKKVDQNAGGVTVQTSGGQTLDNDFAAVTIDQTLGAIEVQFDGSNWWILSQYP